MFHAVTNRMLHKYNFISCKMVNFTKISHSSMVRLVYFWLVLDRSLPQVNLDFLSVVFLVRWPRTLIAKNSNLTLPWQRLTTQLTWAPITVTLAV